MPFATPAPHTIPPPGEPGGPCHPTCEHNACAAQHCAAESPCLLCEEPVGFATPYYVVSYNGAVGGVHTTCFDRHRLAGLPTLDPLALSPA